MTAVSLVWIATCFVVLVSPVCGKMAYSTLVESGETTQEVSDKVVFRQWQRAPFLIDNGTRLDFDKLVEYAETNPFYTPPEFDQTGHIGRLINARNYDEITKWDAILEVFLELRRLYGQHLVVSRHLYDVSDVVSQNKKKNEYSPVIISSHFWKHNPNPNPNRFPLPRNPMKNTSTEVSDDPSPG